MDSKGNLYVQHESGERETVAETLADQIDLLAKKIFGERHDPFRIDITDAPRKLVKALKKEARRQGMIATEGLTYDTNGRKYLIVRKK